MDGQVLVSHTTHELLTEEPLEDVGFRDLGPHRLKDLTQAERIFQLVAEGLAHEFPALRHARRPADEPADAGDAADRSQARARPGLDRIASDEFPILTLTGPGGTGKTRLALQAAADSLGHFPLGDLRRRARADRRTRARLPDDRAHARVEVPRGQALIQLLTDFLAERKLLLVLDNVEHLVAAAPAVAKLARRRAGPQVLATSREPLHVSGERVFPVPPLERTRRSRPAGTPSQPTRRSRSSSSAHRRSDPISR